MSPPMDLALLASLFDANPINDEFVAAVRRVGIVCARRPVAHWTVRA